MWDANQYLKYADERSRPFFDLLGRVQKENVRFAVDLGCGPGNLTRTLCERWPQAQVLGVDSSQDMLEQARALAIPGRLDFVQANVHSWSPDRPVDLIVSNAALQWVSDHESLFPRLAKMLAPGGVLAVQMPFHFENPAHLAMEAIKESPRWRDILQGVGLHQKSVRPLPWYVERLHDLGLTVDAWQTAYLHVLTGENPVLEWFMGTALRPMLAKLPENERDEFLADIGQRFKADYPERSGITLFTFPRLFFVASS